MEVIIGTCPISNQEEMQNQAFSLISQIPQHTGHSDFMEWRGYK